MKVVLLTDRIAPAARPDEQDALVQAREIAAVLEARGDETAHVEITLDLARTARRIEAETPDVVLNLAESVEGSGRMVHVATALLDDLGVPYTGCPTEAMLLTSHKTWAKRLFALHGIPTPPWWEMGAAAADLAPGRYLVKSVWEEASIGIDDSSIVEVRVADDLAREVGLRAPALGGEAFAEALIDGRELNLALLQEGQGVQVLPPAEMTFVDYPPGKPRIVGYAAKWDPASFEFQHTVRRFDLPPGDQDLLARLEGIARACWGAFGLRGYARVDFRVDTAGRPFVLEVNANPCLSSDAGFMAAALQAELDLARVVERLLAAALARWR